MGRDKKYVLVIMDGAADSYRDAAGRSPLGMAHIPYIDKITQMGVCGRMKTLFPALPKESLVAQLGMFGWEPHKYYPSGRASAELLASCGMSLDENDLAFRANLVTLDGQKLISYNANYIVSKDAIPLIAEINSCLAAEFPAFRLYHNSDFRNTLVVLGPGVNPDNLRCIEPHESINQELPLKKLVLAGNDESEKFTAVLNEYLYKVQIVLSDKRANAIVPWSASRAFTLPFFADNTGFAGKVGIVGAMDFLKGIAIAGDMNFFHVGTGKPQTDFEGKGRQVIKLLAGDYRMVICHINAPDEASHMGSLNLKINALQQIDENIVKPLHRYFTENPFELGGVMIIPDHYTNVLCNEHSSKRIVSHTTDPVPFTLWNNIERDEVAAFTEDNVRDGKYGETPVSSLSLIDLLTNNSLYTTKCDLSVLRK